MEIQSLHYRTELTLLAFRGEVLDRQDHLVVRSPQNPTFHWGNLLLFAEPPRAGDFVRWRALFEEAFFGMPEVRHMTFGWDTVAGEVGDVAPFVEAGFLLDQGVVLTADAVSPSPRHNDALEVRTLEGDEDWELAVRNQLDVELLSPEKRQPFEVFKRRQMADYRAMAEAGLGFWFGAFLGPRLVGDLGLFRTGEVGRFQTVGTHPLYRRQGVCGTLVYHASRFGFERMGLSRLVMVADELYHAARIYESVGFRPTQRSRGVTHPTFRLPVAD